MLTTFTKILIGGAALVGGAMVVSAVVSSKEEEKTPKKVESFQEFKERKKAEEEDKSLIKRIKRFVKKKLVKFLTWVALHMEQIEASAAIIGLGSTCIGIVNAVRDFKNGNDIDRKINLLNDKVDAIAAIQVQTNHATNVNTEVIATALDHISKQVGVDEEALHADLEAINPIDKTNEAAEA